MEPAPARARLSDLLATHGDAVPLDLGAALLAADEQPWVDPDGLVADLDDLARGLHIPDGADVFEAIARLSHHLFTEHGFSGDAEAYDDPRNSYLDRVLERRQGLPILLSLVTLEVGRRVGVDLVGVGFPGHFIVAPTKTEASFWLDPFHGGQVLRKEHLADRLRGRIDPAQLEATLPRLTRPVSSREILARMNRNLVSSWTRRNDREGLLRAFERLRLLEPHEPDHLRVLGLLLAEAGSPARAAENLEAYLAARPTDPDADKLQRLLAELREDLP